MSLSPFGGIIVAAVTLVAPDQDESVDSFKIQGSWTVVFYEEAGASLSADITKHWVFEFKGQAVSCVMPGGATIRGTLRLDPSKTPKEIDLAWEDGKTVHAIYDFEDDKLKICMGAGGEVRPKKFASDCASKTGMLIAERKAK